MQPKQVGSTIEPAFRTVLQQTCPKWKAESVFSDLKSLEQRLNATELWSHYHALKTTMPKRHAVRICEYQL
jgi:hypothetical protein